MFSVQINSIETQIQSLTEKLKQYRTLENQVQPVKEALNQIQQTAQALDPEIIPEMFTALGLPATNSQTQEQAQEKEKAEEIATLKQQLLVAERKTKLVQDNYQELECSLISEREILQEEKSSYLQQVKDLEDTAAQFVFPSDIESFIRSGKYEFDLASDLEEVIEHLSKTPDWCVKARVKRLWSMACTLVREHLGEHLPPHLLTHWKEYAAAIQTTSQLENQLEGLSQNQLPSQALEASKEVISEHLPDSKLSVLSDKVSSEEVYNDVFGKQEPETWVNLVEDEEEDYTLGVNIDETYAEGDDWSDRPNNEKNKEQPSLESGDTVRIFSGEVCTIQKIEHVGITAYFTLKLPSGKIQSAYRACDFQRIGTQEQLPQNLVESSLVQASREPVEKVEVLEPVLKVGSRVKVPYGRTGQVMYFATSLMGEESVAVELTSLKGRKKKVEEFPISKVTVLEEEAENVSVLENKNIGRLCDCPDGRRGRIKNTTKQGRFVQAEVSFDDGATQGYDLNSLWLLPQEVASSQAA